MGFQHRYRLPSTADFRWLMYLWKWQVDLSGAIEICAVMTYQDDVSKPRLCMPSWVLLLLHSVVPKRYVSINPWTGHRLGLHLAIRRTWYPSPSRWLNHGEEIQRALIYLNPELVVAYVFEFCSFVQWTSRSLPLSVSGNVSWCSRNM